VENTAKNSATPVSAVKVEKAFTKSTYTEIYKNERVVMSSELNNEEAYAINLLYCPKLTTMKIDSNHLSYYKIVEELPNNIFFFVN
jgi:hypothetical protein